MTDLAGSFVVSFREGLEAFLLIALIFEYLIRTGNKHLGPGAALGTISGVILSLISGLILFKIGSKGELIEIGMGILAGVLIVSFVLFIIKHGENLRKHVIEKTAANLTIKGIFLASLVFVYREGVELAVFAFAGKYQPSLIIAGLSASLIITFLAYTSLFKINLKWLFRITLIYLIYQAGFIAGHAGGELFEEMGLKSAELFEVVLQGVISLVLLGYWFLANKRMLK